MARKTAKKLKTLSFSANGVELTFVKLFHCIPRTETETSHNVMDGASLVARGILFINEDGTVAETVYRPDAVVAIHLFGLSNQDWVNSLHASWDKVRNAPMEQLVLEQAVHYFSTYGLEGLGLDAAPLFPLENICVDLDSSPNVKALTIIRYISDADAVEMLSKYLSRTPAPHKDLFNDLVKLAKIAEIHPDNIASFELKVTQYRNMGIVPTNAQDFLRYLVYEITDSAMLIKNNKTIDIIRSKCPANDVAYLAFKNANLPELAKGFYRFKPLFLAFKADKRCRPYINRIRKLANKYHVPMDGVNAQNLMNLTRQAVQVKDFALVDAAIHGCNVRKSIAILNYIRAEVNRFNSIITSNASSDDGALMECKESTEITPLYFIRNGKIFVDINRSFSGGEIHDKLMMLEELEKRVLRHLKEMLNGKLTDKVFYIPAEMHYTAPISEKQFIGNIPYGSFIELPERDSLCVAVRWNNVDNHRVDLDLHMYSALRAFGWNANVRSDSRDVLYSGDVTDASEGAVEAYQYQPCTDEKFLLTLNEFSGPKNVPFQLFMTSKGLNKARGVYPQGICDVADALFTPIPLVIEEGSMGLGLIDQNRFFFFGGKMDNSRCPNRALYGAFIQSFANKLANMVDICEVISLAGGKVITNADDEDAFIDLSPSALTARSLLDIVDCATV